MTPAGFEDLLGNETTPTELLYLDKTIDEGEIVLSGYGAKRYRSGGQELELDKPYRCASSILIRDIIDDEGLCGAMSFTLREKYEDKVQLVYLQPDEGSVPALNQHFGIGADSGMDTREKEHISQSTVDTVSGSVRYSANFTEGDNANGSLSLAGQVSYAEYLIEAEPIFDRNNGENSLNIGKLLGSRTYAGIKHELGFKPSGQNDLISSSIGVIPSRNMVGGWYSSTNETFRNKQQGTGTPLQVFMPFTGMIEVYRGNRLLYVTREAAGMAQIPVADFPIGVYDVTIVRRSLSGEELEAITDTVSNSLTDSGFTLALGMMNSDERQFDILDGDYDDLVAGFAYQSKVSDSTTGSFSILNIGTAQYFQSTINYQPAFPLGVALSTEFNIQSKDWGVNLQTNYAGTLLGKMVNSNFNYRFRDLLGTESHSYFLNVSLMPNHRYSKLFMINAHASKMNAPQYREDYSELNIENQNAISLFGVPANLSTSLGTSSTDDLRATLSLNFMLGDRQDYSLSTNFTYTGQRESSYGEAILSKQTPEESKLSQLTFTAGGGAEFVRLSADADFRFDSANAYLGGFVYRDARQGTYNSNLYGRASGNIYFSGTQYAFDRSGASSGVIVKMDTQPGSNVEVRADVSGGNSVKLRDSNTLVTVPSFTESSMYINSSNAVIDDYSHDYVLYKGNFAFLSIDPRQTFEAAGYIDFSDLGSDSVTLKNHESKVTVSNHESTVDVLGSDNEEYFQLTVSRQYPVIELIDGKGRSLCTVKLDDSLTASNNQEFVYLGKVGCQNG
ncbi:TcfC E-set like domain-containing protein [Photobacterium gaetbulicola]|uniref:TcfC E-set like domain-containing protein n=1 Tax=Photobacterium gaetbulicola TaxID=1295392 RepID=UPI0013C2AD90|nr:TcfC E-set like domain-containing protein [Photobacterium gaetbulicola]